MVPFASYISRQFSIAYVLYLKIRSLTDDIIRHKVVDIPDVGGACDEPILGPSSESTDTRVAGEGIYLMRSQVDEWSKEVLAEMCPAYSENEADDNPCAECWRNMRTALTAKMWGVFDKTRLFLALCHYGYVLMLADMVRSGEL